MDESQKLRILLVEDHVATGQMYKQILEEKGFVVDYALDGDQALALARNGGYALVLMDVRMPKKDGLTVLRMLKEDPPLKKNGPIVMLTNISDEELVQTAMGLGALSYMDKSDLEPKQLVKKVRGVLGLPEKFKG